MDITQDITVSDNLELVLPIVNAAVKTGLLLYVPRQLKGLKDCRLLADERKEPISHGTVLSSGLLAIRFAVIVRVGVLPPVQVFKEPLTLRKVSRVDERLTVKEASQTGGVPQAISATKATVFIVLAVDVRITPSTKIDHFGLPVKTIVVKEGSCRREKRIRPGHPVAHGLRAIVPKKLPTLG